MSAGLAQVGHGPCVPRRDAIAEQPGRRAPPPRRPPYRRAAPSPGGGTGPPRAARRRRSRPPLNTRPPEATSRISPGASNGGLLAVLQEHGPFLSVHVERADLAAALRGLVEPDPQARRGDPGIPLEEVHVPLQVQDRLPVLLPSEHAVRRDFDDALRVAERPARRLGGVRPGRPGGEQQAKNQRCNPVHRSAPRRPACSLPKPHSGQGKRRSPHYGARFGHSRKIGNPESACGGRAWLLDSRHSARLVAEGLSPE